jgi:hypothetical protein
MQALGSMRAMPGLDRLRHCRGVLLRAVGPCPSTLLCVWAAFLLAALTGCAAATPPPVAPLAPVDLAADLERAFDGEARDPLAAEGYLRTLEQALAEPNDPWALASSLAALDALVSRRIDALGHGVEHALVHRSRANLVEVSQRLRRAYAAAGHSHPVLRALVARALHDLALRVGAERAAAKWRQRAGCVPVATVAGPLAWPPLTSLEGDGAVPHHDALPADFAGVPPFAARVQPQPVAADACSVPLAATGGLRGERALVVDVDVPRAQTVYLLFASGSAARVSLGGAQLLRRRFDAASGATLQIATAEVEAGVARLVARVAYNQDGSTLSVALIGEDGAPLAVRAPTAGARADAKAVGGRVVDVIAPVSRPAELTTAAAALLAAGQARRASQLLDSPVAPAAGEGSAAIELLRVRAAQAAADLPRNQNLARVEAAAKRVLARCSDCWEARIATAAVAARRKGRGVGVFAAFEQLGVDAADARWTERLGPVELAYVSLAASRANLLDVARTGYAALSAKANGSALLADVDWRMHDRIGPELVRAACEGGTDRAGTRCLSALAARDDLAAVERELARLRALRGSPEIHRSLEITQLLAHGLVDRAMRVYGAMPASERTLAALGVRFGMPRAGESAKAFSRDMRFARDAPFAYEPLARLLGVVDDPSAELERAGAEMVARDRRDAFLPGAGTAVLKRLERYRLGDDGLLRYWLYDLRRVSGTSDVARGGWSGRPTIDGRSVQRTLRRRIHKKDGRVIDPDPGARGRQGSTELSQLQVGDYVEVAVEGWALPNDAGQLVVDTTDLLPLRTSVREAEISLERPADQRLSVWTHRLLGEGTSQPSEAGRVRTVWRVREQAPRRIEEGVPPLEARVGLSFGTDDYRRIGRSLGERFRSLDERDPYMGRWVKKALGDAPPEDDERRIARLVAAVGKAVPRADPDALGDFVASMAGGPQRETARRILERGDGSRSWVVHRALRELGYQSSIAVSETRPFSAAPGFPARTGRFRHPLVRVQLGDRLLWIDADVEGQPLPPGRVSTELRGRQALLPSGDMVTVEGRIGVEADSIDVRLTLHENGDASGTFTALIHGRAAQRLAEAFEVVVGSSRTQLLRNVVLGWLPWADVREVKLSSEPGSWQVAIRAEIAIVGYASPEGRDGRSWSLPGMTPLHRVHPRPIATTLAARYARQAGRTTTLAIDQPLFYNVRRTLELPPGVKVSRVPEPLVVVGAALRASRKVEQRGSSLVDEFRLNLPVSTVAAEDSAAFVDAVRRVDDGFRHGTRIEKAKP